MKRTIGTIARTALAAIAMQAGTACGEAVKETVEINDGKYVLTVNLDSGAGLNMTTKAALDEAGETSINNVQIFVFNDDGSLDSYHSEGKSSAIRIRCTAGSKRVFAIVNAPDLNGQTDSTALLSQTSRLTDNRLDNFVMAGRVSATLPNDVSVNVKVNRIVSRVCINSISTAFTSDGYSKLPFSIKSIYMINVAGDTDYGMSAAPKTWHNMAGHKDKSLDALLHAEINEPIAAGSKLNAGQYFYVYPNPATEENAEGSSGTSLLTKLVVEASLDGNTCYYTISLPGLQSNKTYTISSLTITRPGSDNPDEEITSGECPFSIEVEDWINSPEQNIVI